MVTKITEASGTYRFTNWDEKPYAESDGAPKLTHCVVTNVYEGDLVGEGDSQILMFYPSDVAAMGHGFERLSGRLGERPGSFVLQCDSTFEEGVAKTAWHVVPGS